MAKSRIGDPGRTSGRHRRAVAETPFSVQSACTTKLSARANCPDPSLRSRPPLKQRMGPATPPARASPASVARARSARTAPTDARFIRISPDPGLSVHPASRIRAHSAQSLKSEHGRLAEDQSERDVPQGHAANHSQRDGPYGCDGSISAAEGKHKREARGQEERKNSPREQR